jgi:hypothetical protein
MNAWRKSSYSSGQGDNCVEVAASESVSVRDTTNRGGFTLSVPASAWRTFINGIRLS